MPVCGLVEFDNDIRAETCSSLVCGVDEAGRGPLAGPVCCAAVILPNDAVIEGVNDSKKLTERRREALFDKIVESALTYSVIFIDNEDIDRYNILNATMMGMQRAVSSLSLRPEIVLVDGNRLPDITDSARAIVKGDGLSQSVAAASILAKVSRDRLMREYAGAYPEYGFEKHKGYGTKQHYDAISRYGLTPIHRRTFLKGILR